MAKPRKRGDKWYFTIEAGKVAGKRQRIERGGFSTRKEAELARLKTIEEMENGGIIDQSNISISDYLDFWYKEYVELNCRHHTKARYQNEIKNIKKVLGKIKLKSLTPASVQKYVNEESKKNIAFNTLKSRYAVFRTSIRHAVFPYQMLKTDPTTYIKLPKILEEKKIQTITQEEFKNLLNVTNQLRYKLAFLISFHTGMRLSEVCALTWDDVNFKTNEIHVKHSLIYDKPAFISAPLKTKSSNRVILIGQTLINILKEEKERQNELKKVYNEYYFNDNRDFICCSDNGKPIIPATIVSFCSKDLKKRGLEFNFHMLRHTHATMLLEAGANLKDISARLGHSRVNITLDIYSHVTDKMKSNTVDIFEKILE